MAGRDPRGSPATVTLFKAVLAAAGLCGLLAACGRAPTPAAAPSPAPAPPGRPLLFLPTPNAALFEAGGDERYFVGTVGRPWLSGTFGCVRTEGWQMHEGIDIRCVQRDARGEAADPVFAVADGDVVYVNAKAALSNYGVHVILRHRIQGWELYSLYAHLAWAREGLAPGQPVRAGDPIGLMGRTANTREGISRERAHLHFELSLFVSEQFDAWHRKHFPGQRNDHGLWNGRNFLGIDPRLVLLLHHADPAGFDLGAIIRTQPRLCRVLVRTAGFSWPRRYPGLVEPNPVAAAEGVAGYELHLNYSGLPFRVIPRAASEIRSRAKVQLLEVDAAEQKARPCGRLVELKAGRWQLSASGERFLDLLTH